MERLTGIPFSDRRKLELPHRFFSLIPEKTVFSRLIICLIFRTDRQNDKNDKAAGKHQKHAIQACAELKAGPEPDKPDFARRVPGDKKNPRISDSKI